MSTLYEKIYDSAILQTAWAKVRAKRPPPGIDRMRWEDFDAEAERHLEQLAQELAESRYRHLPVMHFERRREGKSPRQLGIAAVRDRVVQQALVQVLSPIAERLLLPCCYAYRPGRSARDAVRQAAKLIEAGHLWALQMDIRDFFDSIDQELLLEVVAKVTGDPSVVKLVGNMVRARVFKQMGLFDHLCGTHQGSGVSPLLSNLYLYPLDHYLWSRYQDRYLRYSDDLTVFAKERGTLEQARHEIPQALKELKLDVQEDKTSLQHVSEGIIYLGYHVDGCGVGPSRKSVAALEERLHAFDKVRSTDSVPEKMAEATSILRGWRSYYADCSMLTPPNPIAFLAWSAILQEDGRTSKVRARIKDFGPETYRHAEMGLRIGDLCLSLGMANQAMRHFARSLELDSECAPAKERIRKLQQESDSPLETIAKTRLVLQSHPDWREGYEKLRDDYVRLGLYGFAQKAHEKVLSLDDSYTPSCFEPPVSDSVDEQRASFDPREVDQELFLNLFQGRVEAHAKQWVDEKGRWGFLRVERPLKKRDIYKHLKGDETLAVYPVSILDTVHFLVFDVDTAKKSILQHGEAALDEFRRKAHSDCLRIKKACAELGGRLYVEDSGYKGRHGWLFFDQPVDAARAISLGRRILQVAGGPSPQMIWELYPMGKSERHRSLIKLPLGINRKSGRRCLFLKDDGDPIDDQGLLLKTIEKASFIQMSNRLSRRRQPRPVGRTAASDPELPGLSSGLQAMIDGCGVLRHLIDKARDTHYLTHFERICLLYTLTFAGVEGEAYLHQVIGYCINYSQDYTQRQIDQRKDNPISCARIMELFPELTEALPCACDLKPPGRGYPSPVLHFLNVEIQPSTAPFEETETQTHTQTEPPVGLEAMVLDKTPSVEGKQRQSETNALLDFEKIFHEEAKDAASTLLGAFEERPGEASPRETDAAKQPENAATSPCAEPWCVATGRDVPMRVDALALEYCRLQGAIIRHRQRLQELAKELEEIFAEMPERRVRTPLGEVSWDREDAEAPTLTLRLRR